MVDEFMYPLSSCPRWLSRVLVTIITVTGESTDAISCKYGGIRVIDGYQGRRIYSTEKVGKAIEVTQGYIIEVYLLVTVAKKP